MGSEFPLLSHPSVQGVKMLKAVLNNSLKGLIVGALSAGALFSLYPQTAPKPATLKVLVAEQQNSPVLLLPTFVDDSNPLVPRYGYSLTNKSDKKITAYTIQRKAVLSDGGTNVGYHVVDFPAVKSLITPNQNRQDELGYVSFQLPPTSITLSIDFVEFADRTRSGADNSKTGEMLDGKRQGGQLAIKKFGEILASKGIEGLSASLESASLIEPPDKTKSDAWLNGFRTGVNVTKLRLTTAKQKGGREGAEKVLKQGFDSVDGRQEP